MSETIQPPPRPARPQAADASLLLGEQDLYLFNEGTHSRLYEKMGAHCLPNGGVHFAVWAPNAQYVSVIGDFNDWNKSAHPMVARASSGLWELLIPEARDGSRYKFHIASKFNGYRVDKVDPFGFEHATPPLKESIVHRLDFDWRDKSWMTDRARRQTLDKPLSIFEMHLGSWMRVPEEKHRWLTYRELAPKLAQYLVDRGFTHVEFLPLMEHPFYGSWGYQTTGYFAPTSRYGSPQDLMFLIDHLHEHEIGVVLDWVPSHFPNDEHGLAYFDGTHLFEHHDMRQGFHPEWKSAIFNYGRFEVRSFLLSSAIFWLEKYHVDCLRVDAVASMLYLDYARLQGQWIPNARGGRENLEAIEFLRQLNREIHTAFPSALTIAEESTAWPKVSGPIRDGGLGFDLKWDMGWMNDTLRYFKEDPLYRKFNHHLLTFRGVYQYSENYLLPLSHDEAVYGKGSLLGRMPGDAWQKFANLRLLLVNQFTQPGKKLLFMGGELAQWAEWNHDTSLDWHLLDWPSHRGVQKLVDDLNRLYRQHPALYEGDCETFGFEWIDADDSSDSVTAFLRRGRRAQDVVLVVMNYTPVPRYNHRFGVPFGGVWRELLNSDAKIYWGSGQGNLGGVEASPMPYYKWLKSITLTLPPLGAVILQPVSTVKSSDHAERASGP
jgi:1,4-alpha-glucan branching enzyme